MNPPEDGQDHQLLPLLTILYCSIQKCIISCPEVILHYIRRMYLSSPELNQLLVVIIIFKVIIITTDILVQEMGLEVKRVSYDL